MTEDVKQAKSRAKSYTSGKIWEFVTKMNYLVKLSLKVNFSQETKKTGNARGNNRNESKHFKT